MAVGTTDDETAIDQAVDDMLTCVGNAGQLSILRDGEGAFRDWALEALEAEFGYEDFDTNMIDAIGESAFMGSYEIWDVGYRNIADQSGYHDGHDEDQEGTGGEFT